MRLEQKVNLIGQQPHLKAVHPIMQLRDQAMLRSGRGIVIARHQKQVVQGVHQAIALEADHADNLNEDNYV